MNAATTIAHAIIAHIIAIGSANAAAAVELMDGFVVLSGDTIIGFHRFSDDADRASFAFSHKNGVPSRWNSVAAIIEQAAKVQP